MAAIILTMIGCKSKEDAGAYIGPSDIRIENGVMTPETLLSLGRISDAQLSPDGSRILYGVSYTSIEQNRSCRNLFLCNPDGSGKVQLTRYGKSVSNARWSADGKSIFFLQGGQLYKAPISGNRLGKKVRLSDVPSGISEFKLSPDESNILYISTIKNKKVVQPADTDPALDKANAYVTEDLMYRHWDHWVTETPRSYVAPMNGETLTPANSVDLLGEEPYELPTEPFGGAEQLDWSPDGRYIAYSCRKHMGKEYAFSTNCGIFVYDILTGQTVTLKGDGGYDTDPVWSPDGTNIAFASAREGSLDVYIMPATGGTPTRLTTHSGNEIPLIFSDAQHVLFSANMMPAVLSSQLASSTFPQVYEVSTTGGRPRLYSTITMEQPSINANGDVLYHDVKGYEDPFRKHHVSAITRDIWLLSKGQYTKLTSFRGEDRNPVWAPDGRSFYYLSEKDGTFNVWKRNTDGSGEQQLTHHTKNPVRFLTADKKGTLCYAYDGEIYVMQNGQERKVNINITTDNNDRSVVRRILHSGATEICLSPNNKEIAFILHGDVYVTAIDYSTTRQITDTPEQERDLSFSPDGRSIAYSSERNGVWQIYRTTLTEKSESQFAYSSNLTEERLTDGQHISQQPK